MALEPIRDAEEAKSMIRQFLLEGKLDPGKMALLDEWCALHPEFRQVFDDLQNPVYVKKMGAIYRKAKQNQPKMYARFLAAIEPAEKSHHSRRFIKQVYAVSAIAASLLIAVSLILLWQSRQGKHSAGVPLIAKVNDIEPGSERAVLTLADGSKVALDSGSTALHLNQGNISVNNNPGGVLAYHEGVRPEDVTLYNTVSTGRGGQYHLVLSDGSKIWLDAASSVRYPVAFSGNRRELYLTGQAFFEVVHSKIPFIVHTAKSEIEDLGTAFNVNAYSDEPAEKTTLLQGAVKIRTGDQTRLLVPGQQANIASDGNMELKSNIDTEEVAAWKDGNFLFRKKDIRTIMSEISRWYDITVEYSGSVSPEKFNIKISRNLSIDHLLGLMAEMKEVSFDIENKSKVVVRTIK